MIRCKRYRIELCRCQNGGFHVSVTPLEYLGEGEFKAWVKLCKSNFMVLTCQKPWRFENAFALHQDAVLFAKSLARQLGEAAFFDRTKGLVMVVAPKEEVEVEQGS